MSRHKPTRGLPSTTGEPAAIYCRISQADDCRISQADDDDQTGADRQERICSGSVRERSLRSR
ncbi:hypothetical protein OG772_18135 [Streptomyces sp. NBC_01321]|uniref:hypothetical protein n=1 Tax=Streptomyces sp. NBC_01321 TaxID=2903825 RepID=UPI002E14A85B|nr:hypothetical protein OG772_18135 [Streptomyces sp. NBC_01321]